MDQDCLGVSVSVSSAVSCVREKKVMGGNQVS